METFWDWVTVFAFAGLATLLLQRSSERNPQDKLWQYFPPAIGCAVANFFGNEGNDLLAGALMVGVIAYIIVVLKVTLPSKKS